MPEIKKCTIKILAGEDHQFRGVGVLICNHEDVNANSIINGMSANERRHLNTSFDYWLLRKNVSKRYHGWNQSDFGGRYVQCFVFKWPENRIYGFLCHPNKQNGRYEFCVLILHDHKTQRLTDETNLRRVEDIRIQLVASVAQLFLEALENLKKKRDAYGTQK